MEIGILQESEILEAVELLDKAFTHVFGIEFYEEYKRLHDPESHIRAMFDESQVYRPVFCVMREEGRLIGIGGYARSLFADYVYELRLAGTLPGYMRRGLGERLRDFRIERVREELRGHEGLVIADIIHPSKYERSGWKYFGKFEDSNLMSLKIGAKNE